MALSVELKRTRCELWEKQKALHGRAESEQRAFTAEENEQWDRMEADDRALEERIKRAEILESRPATDTRVDDPVQPPERAASDQDASRATTAEVNRALDAYAAQRDLTASQRAIVEHQRKVSDAFWTAIRTPRKATAEQRQLLQDRYTSFENHPEYRALAEGLDAAGGYLVPDEQRRDIERALLWYGGMRAVSTVFSTETGNDLSIPTNNDTGNTGALLGENQPVTEQDTTFGMRVFRAYTYTSREIRVSNQLIQDNAYDLPGRLTDMLAERIGRITNTHFTTYNGPDGPTGIIRDSVLGVTAAAAGAIAWNEIIDLEHAVNPAYRSMPGVGYMCHDLTIREFKQLVDGNGMYLWRPAMPERGLSVASLNGYPYTVNNDMPQMATGNISLLFGLLSKYNIRDVLGFLLLVLRERHAENFQTAFIGFSRHDGKLVDAGGSPVQHLIQA